MQITNRYIYFSIFNSVCVFNILRMSADKTAQIVSIDFLMSSVRSCTFRPEITPVNILQYPFLTCSLILFVTISLQIPFLNYNAKCYQLR